MPFRRPAGPLLLLLTFLLAACGPATASGPGERASRRDNNLITAEEIGASGHSNVLDVIRSLRSTWLRERSSSTSGPPDPIFVYVDNTKWGEASTLGQIPVSGVGAIERVSAVDATQRWGPGHAWGVIWIRTVRP